MNSPLSTGISGMKEMRKFDCRPAKAVVGSSRVRFVAPRNVPTAWTLTNGVDSVEPAAANDRMKNFF